LTILF
jgi:hypothetical protein